MAKHHPDLIFCRKQPGVAIGRLCEKCDGKVCLRRLRLPLVRLITLLTLITFGHTVCHLRQLRASVHLGSNLRRVQLRLVPRPLCDLRRTWSVRCVLLQGNLLDSVRDFDPFDRIRSAPSKRRTETDVRR